MKLSKILNEARNGSFIRGLKVVDSSKAVENTSGSMQFATSLYRKKYVNRSEGDEIIQHKNNQTNITALKTIITDHSGLEMSIMIGGKIYSGIIEIDC